MKLLMQVGNQPSLKPPELGGDNGAKEFQDMLSMFKNFAATGDIAVQVRRLCMFAEGWIVD